MLMNPLQSMQNRIDKMSFYERYLFGFLVQLGLIAGVVFIGLVGEWLA